MDLCFISKFLGLLVLAEITRVESRENGRLSNLQKCCDKDELLNISDGNCFKVVGSLGVEGSHNAIGKDIFSRVSAKPHCDLETETLVRRKLEAREVRDLHLYSPDSAPFLDFPIEGDDSSSSRALLGIDKFCLDFTGESDESQMAVEACYPKCSEKGVPCLRKCCGPNQVVSMSNFSCVPVTASEKWKGGGRKVTHVGEPDCEQGTYVVDFGNDSSYDMMKIMSNGNLRMKFNSSEKSWQSIEIPWNEFCIDVTLENEGENEIQGETRIALVCYPDEDWMENQSYNDVLHEFREKLYPFLTGTSALFLLITGTVYLIIYKDLKLPGWLQLCYAITLCVAFSLLTVVQFWTPEIMEWSPLFCKIVGFALHASFLSCFFWLTAMNVDLWLSFRHTPTLRSFGGRCRRGKKRFLGFSLCSTLIPVGVTLAAVFTDEKIRESGSESDLFTGIGETGCALNISNFKVHLLYFYGVVGLLLLVNLMFFCCTVLCLRERRRETKFARRQCSANESADLLRFRLFARLFFVMGVLWVFELLSWLVTFLQLSPWVQLAFVTTDCLNALQGVAVFFLFTWKPQTWRQLKKKWGGLLFGVERSSLSGPHNHNNTAKTSVKSVSTIKSHTSSNKG